MDSQHDLDELFRQLGLSADAASIDRFVLRHRPLPGHLALSDAPFWTSSQATFLCEEIARDADWAELIDRLDAMLRA